MERVFADLDRIGSPNRRGTSYTYFLKRKAGNLLVCHQTAPSADDLDEIEAMGGLESQWVAHDAIRGTAHREIQERFGAPLHFHRIDRSKVRAKTKADVEVYDGESLTHGSDFEAFFLPTCTAGHSVYRWKNRGKYYLFTAHALYYHDGAWDLQFNPRNDWHERIGPLAKQRIDYVFPGYSPADEEGFYRLDDGMRRSLTRAMRSKATVLPTPPVATLAGPSKGLKLDGRLSAAWKRLRAVPFVDRAGNPPPQKSSCRIGWDEQSLWFAVECDEPEMGRLTALATERDSRNPPVWNDDAVEIFLCPDADDRTRAYQFIVNANGTVLDLRHRDTTRLSPDFRWSSGIEAIVTKQKSKWLLQVRIPLVDVGLDEPAGRRIALNVYRDRVCGGPQIFSGWSPTGARSHLTPARFGIVTFT
jgi:hypothetical protein